MRAFIVNHWIHVKSTNFLALRKKVRSYSCTYTRNKYLCKSEFVWSVHKQVMFKVISFSIGVHSKHVWAFWDSARAIETETSQMNTFPVLHAVIVNVKQSAGWIDLKWETLYLLACRLISWNNPLLPREQMFYFWEYVTSVWLLWKS